MEKADVLPLAERAERQVAGLLEDFPADGWCYQPFPGANHALWTAGHLGVVSRRVTALLEGRQPDTPADYQGLFGKGSAPAPDPSAYPAPAQVLAFSTEARAAWLGAVRVVGPERSSPW